MNKSITAILLLSALLGQGAVFPVPARAVDLPPIIVSELLWMGSSASSADEWMELHNTTAATVDLSGWYLTKKSGGGETFMLSVPDGKTIAPNSFFLIANYAEDSPSTTVAVPADLVNTAVALANDQLQIKLYRADGVLIDTADDGIGAPAAGEYVSGSVWKSMERTRGSIDGTRPESWKTAAAQVGFKPAAPEFGTPRAANSNALPIAVVDGPIQGVVGEALVFDGSASSDADGDLLTFAWAFGDGTTASGTAVSHPYGSAGTFSLTLTVSDGQASAEARLSVMILSTQPPVPPSELPPPSPSPAPQHAPTPPSPSQPPASQPTAANGQPTTNTLSASVSPDIGNVLLSEVLANPDGIDADGEFIELVSAEPRAVRLAGWVLTNGRKSYTFPSDAVIEAKGYLVVPRQQFGFSLLNGGGTLYLAAPGKGIVNGVTYPAAKSGVAFARGGAGNWQPTDLPTPGEENEFPEEVDNGQLTVDSERNEEDPRSPSGVGRPFEENVPKPLTISAAKQEAQRTLVTVSGWVSVIPAAFGAQYFYLWDGMNGIMVYSSAKAFPQLSPGDHVEVTGAIGTQQGETKINAKSAEDVRVIDALPMPAPLLLALDDIAEDAVGALVRVTGILNDTNRSTAVLEEAGNQLAVVLARGTDLRWSSLSLDGKTVEVTGILRPRDGARALFPRREEDFLEHDPVTVQAEEEKPMENADAGRVLGATTELLPPPKEERTGMLWVGLGSGIALFVGGFLVWRRWRASRERHP